MREAIRFHPESGIKIPFAGPDGGNAVIGEDYFFFTLETGELLARLAVEIFAVHDEDALVDVLVFLEQGGGLEGGERLAAAGGVPDVAVAVVVINARDHVLHGIDLIGPHDHELLLAGDEDHVAADGTAEVALFQEGVGEGVQLGDLLVILAGEFIDGQEALIGVKGKVAGVVVGEVVGAVAVADDEELHEAEQRLGVAITGIVLVFDDLLHRPARADAEGFQLDLHAGHAVDEKDHIVTVVAVIRIDAELVDDLEGVFVPVLDVDEGVVQRRAVISGEAADGAQGLGSGEDIWGDDLVKQAGELGISEADAIERLEFFPEVLLQRGAVGDVATIFVFEAAEFLDQV